MTTERLMPMLCIVTGNPCRTDTVPIGAECPAPGGVCVRRLERERDEARDALRKLINWMPRVVPAVGQEDEWEAEVNAAVALLGEAT